MPAPDGRATNPVHLVLLPAREGETDTRRIEALLAIEPYEAGLLLRARVPRIVRSLGDASAAEEMQERARLMGLRTFLVDDHSLDTHPPSLLVERAATEGEALVLAGEFGSFRAATGAAELVVAARVPVVRRRTSSRISMLASVPGSTPGMPRLVKEVRETTDHFGVLDLYPAGGDRCLRVREESTDFRGLGTGSPASALLRFRRLLDLIRTACADAPFDQGFARSGAEAADSGRFAPEGAVVKIVDGVSRFGRYSRLHWWARRAAAGAAPRSTGSVPPGHGGA